MNVNWQTNTVVVVSDWRNSLDPKFNDGREAELLLSIGKLSDVAYLTWTSLGTQYHSQIVDLRTFPGPAGAN